jgi:hypothetical protein
VAIELLPSDAARLGLIEPFLIDALERGGGARDWLIEDVRELAIKREIDLWELRADGELFGGAVSVMRQFPRRLTLDILLLGTYPHRERELFQVLALIKALARQAGATAITGTGRPGWARMLKSRESRVFEIDLTEDQP